VSEWTIRRDLDLLEQRNRVMRFHGGVKIIEEGIPAIHQSRAIEQNLQAKQQIGLTAAGLVQAHSHVLLSASSTAAQVANALKQSRKQLSVTTNSLTIAANLADCPTLSVTCTGGEVDEHFLSLNGPLAEQALRNTFFDMVVIGVNGISENGLTVESPVNARTLELMVEEAGSVMVVADNTKVGHTAAYCLAPLEATSIFVTDTRPDTAFAALLDTFGIRLVVAEG